MKRMLVNMLTRIEHPSLLHRPEARPWPAPWKRACFRGIYASGALRSLRACSHFAEYDEGRRTLFPRLGRTQPKYAVLCYHRIGVGGVPLYNGLLPSFFEAQIAYVRKNYRVISVAQLTRELRSGGTRGHSVAITFDDGYRDLYRYALPVLCKYNIPATIYLTAGSVDSGEIAWYDRLFLALKLYRGDALELQLGDQLHRFTMLCADDRVNAGHEIIAYLRSRPEVERADFCAWLEAKVPLPRHEICGHMLNWGQVQIMHRAGIDFGSHTMTHRVLGRLLPEEQDYELQESRKLIESKLDAEVLDFAYPFGKPNDCAESERAVVRAGYRSAMTTSLGVNVSHITNPYQVRRVQLGQLGLPAIFACYLTHLFFQSGKYFDASLRGATAPAAESFCSAKSGSYPSHTAIEAEWQAEAKIARSK